MREKFNNKNFNDEREFYIYIEKERGEEVEIS